MKKLIFGAIQKLGVYDKERLARDTDNPKLLYRLAFDPSVTVLDAVAQNDDTPTGALKVIIEHLGDLDDSYRLIKHILFNPNCTKDLALYIVNNYEDSLRWEHINRLAELAKDDHEFAAALANSSNHPIRCRVAGTTKFQDILEQLSYDSDYNVRLAVANNKMTPTECLEVLAYDPESDIRVSASRNPNAPMGTVLALLDDESTDFDTVVHILNQRKFSTKDVNKYLSQLLARDHSAGTRDFDRSTTHSLYGLVDDYKLSNDILLKLLDYNDSTVNTHIANRQHISSAVVNKLLQLNNFERYSYRYKPYEGPVWLSLLARCTDSSFLEYVPDKSDIVSRILANNPHTPKSRLKQLATYTDRLTRMAAAQTLGLDTGADSVTDDELAGLEWSISPYELTEYMYISTELNMVLPKVFVKVAKDLGCKVDYKFDTTDYDNATKLVVTTDTGKSVTIDAQRFLAQLTSVPSKRSGINKASKYVEDALSRA